MSVKFSQENMNPIWCLARGKPIDLDENLNGARTAKPAVTNRTNNGVSEWVTKSPPHNMSSIAHACNTDDIKMIANVAYLIKYYVIITNRHSILSLDLSTLSINNLDQGQPSICYFKLTLLNTLEQGLLHLNSSDQTTSTNTPDQRLPNI